MKLGCGWGWKVNSIRGQEDWLYGLANRSITQALISFRVLSRFSLFEQQRASFSIHDATSIFLRSPTSSPPFNPFLHHPAQSQWEKILSSGQILSPCCQTMFFLIFQLCWGPLQHPTTAMLTIRWRKLIWDSVAPLNWFPRLAPWYFKYGSKKRAKITSHDNHDSDVISNVWTTK